MANVKFRDNNDKIHFFGSAGLTVVFFAQFLAFTNRSGWESFFIAFLASFTCGLLMEIVTQFTPAQNAPFWRKLPPLFGKMFSRSPWDHRDVELNALGALVFYPVVIAIGTIFIRRAHKLARHAPQPAGIPCVNCEREKEETDGRRWFTITFGKRVFYACPRCFPIYATKDEKTSRLAAILEKINRRNS